MKWWPLDSCWVVLIALTSGRIACSVGPLPCQAAVVQRLAISWRCRLLIRWAPGPSAAPTTTLPSHLFVVEQSLAGDASARRAQAWGKKISHLFAALSPLSPHSAHSSPIPLPPPPLLILSPSSSGAGAGRRHSAAVQRPQHGRKPARRPERTPTWRRNGADGPGHGWLGAGARQPWHRQRWVASTASIVLRALPLTRPDPQPPPCSPCVPDRGRCRGERGESLAAASPRTRQTQMGAANGAMRVEGGDPVDATAGAAKTRPHPSNTTWIQRAWFRRGAQGREGGVFQEIDSYSPEESEMSWSELS